MSSLRSAALTAAVLVITKRATGITILHPWMADAGDTVTIEDGEPLAMSTAAVGASGGATGKSESAPKKTK